MLDLIISLAVAALVGYLAGQFMNLKSAWYINIVLGLLGGFVGSIVFGLIGIDSSNIIGSIVISTVGACLVIFLYKKFVK